MQVFANLPLKRLSAVRGGRQTTYYSGWFDAVRLIGPERQSVEAYSRGRSYIWADVSVPDDLKDSVQGPFEADGTRRVQVWTGSHLKTLGPFLASGDLEWDVRGRAE